VSSDNPKVTVYSTTWCGSCVAAKKLLSKRGIDYVDINLDDDPSFRAKLMDLTGRFTVPQIFVGERHVGGFDDLRVLDQSGQLAELVEQAA
jgi:glutaredoxin 3